MGIEDERLGEVSGEQLPFILDEWGALLRRDAAEGAREMLTGTQDVRLATFRELLGIMLEDDTTPDLILYEWERGELGYYYGRLSAELADEQARDGQDRSAEIELYSRYSEILLDPSSGGQS